MRGRLILGLGVTILFVGTAMVSFRTNSERNRSAESTQSADAYAEVSSLIARDTFDRMNDVQRNMVVTLARRSAIGPPTCAACFAPGTPQDVIQAFNDAIFGGPNARFQLVGRWTSTVTDGGGLSNGDPTTLTYSFAPDGTFIPSGVGEPSGPSTLFAALDAHFASTAEWQDRYHEMFARWSELTGITYVFEPFDDGASFFGNGGSIGRRGDVRMGGKFIDGGSGVLAYNNFPFAGGDMVIDTADAGLYGNASSNWIFLRNVVAHEHGHGIGIAHVCPANQTKLMEPFITIAFDGAQHDDIRAGNRMYGDPLEDNDTSGTATDLGAIEDGTIHLSGLSIDDNSDNDYYRFTVPGPTELSVTVTPIGFQYQSGGQTQQCNSGNSIDTLDDHDLSVNVLDTNGVTVLASANGNPAGVAETISNLFLPAPSGGTFFVHVIPSGTNGVQMYELDVIVTDLDCNDNGVLDDDDLSGGTSEDCNANGVPDECDRDCNENGTPDECDIAGGTLTDANSNGFADECEVLRVDLSAAGSESGQSWTDAMTDLGAATAVAADPSNGFTEIWVAAGTHVPDSGSGDRKASFVLAPGVSMYGGFAGTETARDERDAAANVTILSGDLNGDDDGGGDNSENSLHVVSAVDVTAGTVFDGFIITGGNANDTGNTNAGGMSIQGGDGPIVRNCVFVGNAASNLGGGINSNNNTARIEGCSFFDNRADNRGGGLNNGGTGLGTIVNCLFSGNSANNGGAMTNAGKPDVVNCTFSRNSADNNGGGIYNLGGGSILTLSNCVLWNNDDTGGMDESAQVFVANGTVNVDYNCIQGWTGGLGGVGNIGVDPLLIDPDGDDNVIGTEDDNSRLGDLSPCIDAADNTAVPAGILEDRDGNPRFADDPDTTDSGNGTAPIVDMGAYELPVEGCTNPCGDINGSGGNVDLVDFASFAGCFNQPPDSSPACLCSDLDESGTINLIDFATLSLLFGSTPTGTIPNCTP